MLSENQIQLGNITTKPIQQGQVGSNTTLTGMLVVDQTQADLISSRAAGRIERLYVKETGQQIKKGQLLYDLYNETLLTLEQEYLLTLDQVKAFPGEKQFISILDASKRKLVLTSLTNSHINRIARTRTLDVRITFVAPASGTVTEISAAEGGYVAEGSPLYRISRFNSIWVEAELYAGEASQLKVGTPVEVNVAGSATPVKTKIYFINPEFRQNSQVVIARAALPNPQGRLIPGSQATMTLAAPERQALTLPLDAVIRDSKGVHVWVKLGENTFSPRMLKLGEESANQVAITSGLQPSDTMVMTGAYLLYSEYVLKQGQTHKDHISLNGAKFSHHINISPDKTRLAVAITSTDLSAGHDAGGMAGMSGFKVMVLNNYTGKIEKEIMLPKMPHNAAFNSDGSELWVSQEDDHQSQVLVYDVGSWGIKHTILVGRGLSEVTFSADGSRVFASYTKDATISVILPDTKAVIATIPVGKDPVGAWPALNGYMYADNETDQTISEIEVSTNQVTATITLGFKPGYVAYHVSQRELWVSDATNGKVIFYKKVNAQWAKQGEIATRADAHAIAFSPDGTIGYVTNQGAGTVSIINVSEHRVRSAIPVGEKPTGIILRP